MGPTDRHVTDTFQREMRFSIKKKRKKRKVKCKRSMARNAIQMQTKCINSFLET